MASELESQNITSWVRKFYNVVNRLVVDPKTGAESFGCFDVCNLSIDSGDMCQKSYKHNLRNGTKTLQRHILDCHRFSPAVQAAIAVRNIALPEVR